MSKDYLALSDPAESEFWTAGTIFQLALLLCIIVFFASTCIGSKKETVSTPTAPIESPFSRQLKLAESGNTVSQYNIGMMYYNGEGVFRDVNQALLWWRRSAEAGNSLAQSTLGNCYFDGIGVVRDFSEAARWYERAAEGGDNTAQALFGACYLSGTGVSQDYEKAVYWFNKAANKGNCVAQYELALISINGMGQPAPPEQSFGLLLSSAESGYAKSQYVLGNCYYDGYGVSPDRSEAFYWYTRAAKQGHGQAQRALGLYYLYGISASPDFAEAYKWFCIAGRNGTPCDNEKSYISSILPSNMISDAVDRSFRFSTSMEIASLEKVDTALTLTPSQAKYVILQSMATQAGVSMPEMASALDKELSSRGLQDWSHGGFE